MNCKCLIGRNWRRCTVVRGWKLEEEKVSDTVKIFFGLDLASLAPLSLARALAFSHH